jgi:NAD(P)-dependent dehydrogenase (short-subunit alcohol dehydrogenase family)
MSSSPPTAEVVVGQSDHHRPVTVITGASRGLGAGMAEAFAGEGMRLGLCARTCPNAPTVGMALTASVDVTDAGAVDSFAHQVCDQFGRIDLWVNNAGVLDPIGPLVDADPEALRRHLEINVLGALFGSATFARHVRERPGRGVLVNISSGAATKPYEGWAAYCASKAAVEMMTEVIAREEHAHGLDAYAVAPGVVDTDMQVLIRSTPAESFPDVRRFRRRHEDQAFNAPSWVARFIIDQCLDGADRPETADHVSSVRLRVPDQPRRA